MNPSNNKSILLAIDTACNLCSAGLFDCQKGKIIATVSEDIGRGHAERLMGLLAGLLAGAGLNYQDIGRIAATTGPGSFTGIRVGLATARGLALGLGVPVAGIGVLAAIGFQHQAHNRQNDIPLVVVMEAKRGEVFMQDFGPGKTRPPMAVAVDVIDDHLPRSNFRIAGSAADNVVGLSGRSDVEIVSRQGAVDIECLATMAAQLDVDSQRPKPLYLRSADAKPQLNFAVARKNSVDLQGA